MYSSSRCKHRTYLCGTEATQAHISFHMSMNGNLRKSWSKFLNGTVFALNQCFHQKEATGIESPKMYFTSRGKNRTYLCGTANYSFSCKPV